MYSMQGSTGENEPVSSEDEGTTKDFVVEPFLWALQFFTVSYLVYTMFSMLSEDEVRLRILHAITKVLQGLARIIGSWALEFENSYNEYVDSLH